MASEAVSADWELNLFHSDPTLLQASPDEHYERAARALERIADADRLRLLHALVVGENTAQRAAVWSGIEGTVAERELATLALLGIVERCDGPHGAVYLPRDGHLIVELHVALAHGRERDADEHPRLLARRRRVAAGKRAG